MISHAICTHVPDMPGATHGIEGRGRRVIGFHTYVHRYTYTSYMLLNMDQRWVSYILVTRTSYTRTCNETWIRGDQKG